MNPTKKGYTMKQMKEDYDKLIKGLNGRDEAVLNKDEIIENLKEELYREKQKNRMFMRVKRENDTIKEFLKERNMEWGKIEEEIQDENDSKNSFMETGLPLITLIGTFICMGISVMNRQNGYEEDIIKLCDYQTIEFRR